MTIFTPIVAIAFLVILVVYKTTSTLIARFLWNKFAVVKDVPLLSKARPKDEKFSGTAIICGGSIAGLFAARVCANHFEKVLIIEPEEWVAVGEKGLEDRHRDPNAPKRSRVAQYTAYHHFHYIMTLCMEEMFSSFEQALQSVGGRLTACYDRLLVSGVPKLTPLNYPSYSRDVYPRHISISRPGFETTLRRLVVQHYKQVQFLHGTVTDLLYDEKLNRASGVSVKLPTGGNTEIEGALVVDATGSFMAGHRWLKAIPKFANLHSPLLDDIKISFDPKVSYTLAEFTLPSAMEKDLRQYGFPTDGDNFCSWHACLADDKLLSIDKREKNFFIINCGAYDWDGRIRSIGDIEDFMRDLNLKRPLPQWMYDLLRTLQKEDVPVSFQDFKYHSSVYIKYHEIKDLPFNFVALGDAQVQTDPIFAQGLAKVCATTIILNYQLHHSSRNAVGDLPRNFAQKYFLDIKNRTEHVWENMKNMDYNYSSTVPLPGEDIKTTARFARTFAEIVLSLTTKDPEISEAFIKGVSWLEPPTAMMAPWIVRRVAWAWIKQLFGYEIL